MTFKKKSNLPLNTISSTSGGFSQSKFANGNSYNSGRNNRGRFPTSNKSYNKRAYANVSYYYLILKIVLTSYLMVIIFIL